MSVRVLRGRSRAWLIPPLLLALLVAVALARPAVAGATPTLPPRTPAQLITAAADSWRQPFSGTVSWTADLGLPALPNISPNGGPGAQASSTDLPSLLSGSHTARVWYSSPSRFRLALIDQLAETDLVRDGANVWSWQSQSRKATHLTLPASASGRYDAGAPALTPPQAAQSLLRALDPTTAVAADSALSVAGRDAYQITLRPRTTQTLVGSVTLALDAKTSLPLRLQVFARGATTPAFQVGFTSVTMGTPAAAALTFTPPAGVPVTEISPPAERPGHPPVPGAIPGSEVVGTGWASVLVLPASGALSASGGSTGGATADTLMRAATYVRGSWGSGYLLKSTLVNALLTTKGHLLVGAVPPNVLYAAASGR